MPTLTYTSPIDAPADFVFGWHANPGAFERLVPPWADVRLKSFEGIRDGQRAVLSVPAGVLRLKWVARHEAYEEGRQFRDVQERGPFAAWAHLHRMEPVGEAQSRLVDHIEFALPLGTLGERVAGGLIRRQLDAQFAYRHAITQADVAAHYAARDRPRLRIAISGASGTIGRALRPFLTTGGHEVVRLVRSPSSAADAAFWDPETGDLEAGKLEGLDAVIHLAGEPVLEVPWTKAKKMRIYGSRVRATERLIKALLALDAPPRTILSASGVHVYADPTDDPQTEGAPPSDDFLGVVAREWEAATAPAADAGVRVVHLRFGAVLTPGSGLLGSMTPFFRIGLGPTVGAPDRPLTWASRTDAVHAMHHLLLHSDLDGPINVVAPEPVTMRTFADTLARVLKRPRALHVPEGLVHAVGGEATRNLLRASRAAPERLLASGYTFVHPDLEDALRVLLGKAAPPQPA